MWFWIPLAIFIIGASLLIWAAAVSYSSETDVASGMGIIFLAIFAGSFMLFGPGMTDSHESRVTESHKLIPFEDGELIHTTFNESGALISYQIESEDGNILPYTVEDDEYEIVYGAEGSLVSVQRYYDNPAVWPWFREGLTTTELRLPND